MLPTLELPIEELKRLFAQDIINSLSEDVNKINALIAEFNAKPGDKANDVNKLFLECVNLQNKIKILFDCRKFPLVDTIIEKINLVMAAIEEQYPLSAKEDSSDSQKKSDDSRSSDVSPDESSQGSIENNSDEEDKSDENDESEDDENDISEFIMMISQRLHAELDNEKNSRFIELYLDLAVKAEKEFFNDLDKYNTCLGLLNALVPNNLELFSPLLIDIEIPSVLCDILQELKTRRLLNISIVKKLVDNILAHNENDKYCDQLQLVLQNVRSEVSIPSATPAKASKRAADSDNESLQGNENLGHETKSSRRQSPPPLLWVRKPPAFYFPVPAAAGLAQVFPTQSQENSVDTNVEYDLVENRPR